MLEVACLELNMWEERYFLSLLNFVYIVSNTSEEKFEKCPTDGIDRMQNVGHKEEEGSWLLRGKGCNAPSQPM